MRTAVGSPDVPVPDVVSACAAGTLAVDQGNNVITCSVADEPVITTYTVAAEAGNTVDLSTCDGITLDENDGKITCTTPATDAEKTTYTALKLESSKSRNTACSKGELVNLACRCAVEPSAGAGGAGAGAGAGGWHPGLLHRPFTRWPT